MSASYRIVLLGEISLFDERIEEALNNQLKQFDLLLGREVEIIGPDDKFEVKNHVSTVAMYFGSEQHKSNPGHEALQPHHPILPIVSRLENAHNELPWELSALNAIQRSSTDTEFPIASAVLECLRILPSGRRIFLSYRRNESRQVALQLFDELSSRQFNVFLDTHEIRPAEVFQDVLWHHLSESDVMLMLDTKSYFESRWTTEEFTKANLKMAAILRLGWPGVGRSKDLCVTNSIQLEASDFEPDGLLSESTLDVVSDDLERLRSKSVSVREANLIGTFRSAVSLHGGKTEEPARYRKLVVSFSPSKSLLVYPAVGVPSSELVNLIHEDSQDKEFAILYDHVGVMERWMRHLDWLGAQVHRLHWIKASTSADFLDDFLKSISDG